MAETDNHRMTGKELRELERTDPDEYARIKRKMENFDGPAERLVWLWIFSPIGAREACAGAAGEIGFERSS